MLNAELIYDEVFSAGRALKYNCVHTDEVDTIFRPFCHTLSEEQSDELTGNVLHVLQKAAFVAGFNAAVSLLIKLNVE
jgi:hypothetical protein